MSNRSSLLAAVNAARAAHGLGPLEPETRLRRAAQSHTVYMLQTGVFAHGAFAQRMRSFHVHNRFMAENLAWGSGSYGSATAIVQAWLASPPHRANLLRPDFKWIGLGVERGTFEGYSGVVIVTADFGSS